MRAHGHAPSGASRASLVWIVGAALVAFVAKLAIAFNTVGTNDVIAFYRFAQALSQQGMASTYANQIAFNHPPLVAWYIEWIHDLSTLPALSGNGIDFPFLLRLPGIVADLVVVLLLVRMAGEASRLRLPFWALLLFALSPVSLMVSGFHGNTDPVIVMFLMLAAYMCLKDAPVWCGLFFALSFQIKVIPLLLAPILFFYWWQRRSLIRFAVPVALTTLALWSVPLLSFPGVFLKNVLSYGSFWGLWGITYFLRLTGLPAFSEVMYYKLSPAEQIVGALLKVFIILCVLMIAWRRRTASAEGVFHSMAYAWIAFFVFSPGVAAQYMVWLAPFILVLSPTFYGYLTAGSTMFVFFFYNTIADKFPWYLAISRHRNNLDWTPWTVWPWAILIAGMVILWKRAQSRDPLLRLVSLEKVAPADTDHRTAVSQTIS